MVAQFTLRRACTALSLVMIAALAACGGGGDSTPAGPLSITAANANAVARAGVAGLQVGQLAGGMGSGAVAPTGQQAIISQVGQAHAMATKAISAQRRPMASGQATVPCAFGGSMTVSVVDSNNSNALDAVGESVSATANACSETAGVVVNGGFALTLTQYTDSANLAFRLSFNSFKATNSQDATAVGMNGALTVSVAAGSSLTLSSDILTATATTQGADHSFSVQNYAVTLIVSSTQITETVAGTFSSSDFAGKSVTVSTLTPVVALTTDNYPTSGAVLIQGANQSAVKIEAYSLTQAKVSVDADGNGTWETVTYVNWSDLG